MSPPLLMPVAEADGIGPTHLGIIMILNLEIGILTPPMGLSLIVAMTAFNEKFSTICISVIPRIMLILAALLLISFQPWIALYSVNQRISRRAVMRRKTGFRGFQRPWFDSFWGKPRN